MLEDCVRTNKITVRQAQVQDGEEVHCRADEVVTAKNLVLRVITMHFRIAHIVAL
jgi:hypothetical protein